MYKADSVSAPNRNGDDPTMIRIYLVNPVTQIGEWWAYNISNGENQQFTTQGMYYNGSKWGMAWQ